MWQLSRRKLKNKMSKKLKCSREKPAQTITVELGACPSAKSSKMINNSDICVHLALRGRSMNLISPYSTCGDPWGDPVGPISLFFCWGRSANLISPYSTSCPLWTAPRPTGGLLVCSEKVIWPNPPISACGCMSLLGRCLLTSAYCNSWSFPPFTWGEVLPPWIPDNLHVRRCSHINLLWWSILPLALLLSLLLWAQTITKAAIKPMSSKESTIPITIRVGGPVVKV